MSTSYHTHTHTCAETHTHVCADPHKHTHAQKDRNKGGYGKPAGRQNIWPRLMINVRTFINAFSKFSTIYINGLI